jgi:hypothetical protein
LKLFARLVLPSSSSGNQLAVQAEPRCSTMIKRGWSAEDVTALRYGRFQHSDPRVHVRMEALYVRSQGVTKGEIRRLWRISSASFPRDLKAYVAGGVEPRKRSDHDRPPRELAHDRTTR